MIKNLIKIFYIMISMLFLFSCDKETKLTNEMTGEFIGHEPPSFMKVGNKQIKVPGSKWRIEIADDKIIMIQVSDGQTISYEGEYLVTDETEESLTISGHLKDDQYNQNYTPTLKFNKNNKKWFLQGTAGSEGTYLKKLIE